jgi:hypothetical protein
MTESTELSRQIREALNRLEALATRLDTHYVTKDIFLKQIELNNEVHKNLRGDIDSTSDNIKWVVRLVLGVVVLSLLGVVFATNGGTR